MDAPTCPECGAGPLVRGTFCRDCGWDGELAYGDDAYLDDVDLPQGYADDDPDGFDYEAVLRREGLLGDDGEAGAGKPSASAHVYLAAILVAFLALLALLSSR